MYEHRLSWYSGDGTGETISLESETVTGDRFWDVWKDAMLSIFSGSEDANPEITHLTREQFRTVAKALVEAGHFRPVAPREVAVHEFRTGKGWEDKKES